MIRYGSVCSDVSVGDRFGRLTVTDKVPGRRRDQWRWRLQCDRGRVLVLPGGNLTARKNRSCGCFRRDRAGGLVRKHGKSRTPAYCMFYGARKRAFALGIPFTIEPTDIAIPAICPVLGIDLTHDGPRDTRPSLDRRIPALGYVPGNVNVISFRANRIKSDATAAELRRVLAYTEGT